MNEHAAYFETKDGAKLYYEDQGRGDTILLLHGWTCSSKFWRRNVPELKKRFRVVTMDLRGHGNSSKILSGHTVAQYAKDARALIEHLDLRDVTMLGWSLGGPTVLSYWQQYAADSRLKGLGLIDATPFPFSPGQWNGHGLRDYNVDGMNANFAIYQADPLKYSVAFTHKMFKDERVSEEDVQWITAEMLKTPTAVGVAAYSDYLMSDYTKVLPTIRVPGIVFSGEVGIYKDGFGQGRYIAGQIPQGVFVGFNDAGHMLFYEQPDKFNNAVADFVNGLNN